MYLSCAALVLASLAIPRSLAADHTVNVGGIWGDRFSPKILRAKAGDNITFVASDLDTIHQSDFEPPCIPKKNGWSSGEADVSVYSLPENYAGEPLWFYTDKYLSCGRGMVFAINPPWNPREKMSYWDYLDLALERNGTGAATVSPQPKQEATATVSHSGTVYTTTYTSYLGSIDPTPASVPNDSLILVGSEGNPGFTSIQTAVRVGSTVTFEFRSGNHSVVQSSFESPCEPLTDEFGSLVGFVSGFMPVPEGTTRDFPRAFIEVENTEPMYGYNGRYEDCIKGLVWSVNADGANEELRSLYGSAAFVENAKRIPELIANYSIPTEAPSYQGNSGVRDAIPRSLTGVLLCVTWLSLGL